tara:strand:- start:234 stop:875 length:642 start_codon:yes stop_codon:yes gene_type:complete
MAYRNRNIRKGTHGTFTTRELGDIQQRYHAKKYGREFDEWTKDVDDHYQDVTSLKSVPVVGDILAWGESTIKGPATDKSKSLHKSAWLDKDITTPMERDVKDYIDDMEASIDSAALNQIIELAASAVLQKYAPNLAQTFLGKEKQLGGQLMSKGFNFLWNKLQAGGSALSSLGVEGLGSAAATASYAWDVFKAQDAWESAGGDDYYHYSWDEE